MRLKLKSIAGLYWSLWTRSERLAVRQEFKKQIHLLVLDQLNGQGTFSNATG